MNYKLTKDVIDLIQEFEAATAGKTYEDTIQGFKQWVADTATHMPKDTGEPDWEGKAEGRSPEGAISTLIVHMNRYGKMYSKAAISGTAFSNQEDFIYLINLKAHGTMTKTELIRKNIQDKPTGMQIINRLMKQGWVKQANSGTDRRSKEISITDEGLNALEERMQQIRLATKIVSGNLTHPEKMELIRILQKLENFHKPIFDSNIRIADLLAEVNSKYLHN